MTISSFLKLTPLLFILAACGGGDVKDAAPTPAADQIQTTSELVQEADLQAGASARSEAPSRAYKPRVEIQPSQASASLVEVEASSVLSMDEISLGDAPVESRAAFKPASERARPDLIEKTFKVTNPNTLYAITATPADHVGFRLGLIKANDEPLAENLIYDRRHFGINKDPINLHNVSLPIGDYSILIRPDDEVQIDLLIDEEAPPSVRQLEPGSARTPSSVGQDVVAVAGSYYVSPSDLDANKTYTAALSFPTGSGNLAILDGSGTVIERRTGSSPLTFTGLKGGDWGFKVEHRPSADAPPNSNWRLKLYEIDASSDFDEVASANVTSQIKDDVDGLAGWLDPSDEDHFFIGQTETEAEAYFLEYSGPYAKLQAGVEGRNKFQFGTELVLGPYPMNAELEFTVSSYRGSLGPYSIKHVPIDSASPIALEPDNNQMRFGSTDRVSGTISHSEDDDYITFDLGDEAQMWRPMILGRTISDVSIESTYEERFRHRRSLRNAPKRRFPTPDLYLGPGPVTIGLSGIAGDYTVFMKPLGSPLETSEREPNEGNFSRRIEFKNNYIGSLQDADRDSYSFFAERPALVEIDLYIPVGAIYQVEHVVNGTSNQRSPIHRKDLTGASRHLVDVNPGENTFTLSARTPSPAEYEIGFRYVPPSDLLGDAAPTILPSTTVQAFSLNAQRVEIGAQLTADASAWSPSTKVSIEENGGLTIAPDLATGTYPIWVKTGPGADVFRVDLIATPDAPEAGPKGHHSIPAPMRGGLNLASAALGAKWLSQPGYELNEESVLPRSNPANATSVNALNDGIRALSGDGAYYHVFSNRSDEIYAPTLRLAGEQPSPIVGVALTDRSITQNYFGSFAVDVSIDGTSWEEALSANLTSWSERQFFVFPEGPQDAQFVRLRALRAPNEQSFLALGEFEVISSPGASGFGAIGLLNQYLGAAGRYLNNKTYNRDIIYGLSPDTAPTTVRVEDGVTDLALTHTFKNQAVAEIEAIEFHFGETRNTAGSRGPVPSPQYARILGSRSGPNGPFLQEIEVELPSDFGPGVITRIDLPERLVANAVRVEYVAKADTDRDLQPPVFYQLFERPEGADYISVLGLNDEYTAREYRANSTGSDDIVPYTGANAFLSTDGRAHTGSVELEAIENTWRVEPSGNENTLILTARGEPGFFPSVQVAHKSGQTLEPISIDENTLKAETTWQYDLPAQGLMVTVKEPPRSTVFLMDQSASAAPYIARARRSVIDYADTMVEGQDRIQFAALGREWFNADWVTDPVTLRRKLIEYHTDGNSSGETAIIKAAKLLKETLGTRSIVILTDGDVGPTSSIFADLAASNARVFPIKISSAKIWGNPVTAMNFTVQWSEVTGGEFAYVLNDQDITDSYSRIASRLLGPKSYTLTAAAETRLIAPGQLEVTLAGAQTGRAAQGDTSYHVLFDASGSMLKRTGNTRRIAIAQDALARFVEATLKDDQKIGLRVFGGAPDTCETSLALAPGQFGKARFAETVSAIRPKNNAKTPIATALSHLSDDLASIEDPVQVLLITDGEETCDGDAGDVIDSLMATGLTNRVDIVSFALAPEIDRTDFQDWAKRGRGLYIDAQNGEGLADALEQTVQMRYDVMKEGSVIASGLVDSPPIDLPVGDYQILVGTQTFDVVVKSGNLSSVKVSTDL